MHVTLEVTRAVYLEGNVPIPWRFRRPFERAARALTLTQVPRSTLVASHEPATASLICVGDIALHKTRSLQPEDLLTDVLKLWLAADARIGNLETVCTRRTTPAGTIGASLRADPTAVRFLSAAKLTAVTVANNHSLDYGSDALRETVGAVTEAGIAVCGYTDGRNRPAVPAFFNIGSLRAGMLGYCDAWRPPVTEPVDYSPSPVPPPEQMAADVQRLSAEVDIVIVQVHWGYEFALHPLRRHRDVARRLAEAGAHLVLCHHAHVPMGYEVWGRSFISHGLGNWLFEPDPYLCDGHDWTQLSYLVKIGLAKGGVCQADIVPVETVSGPSVRLMHGWKRRQFVQCLGRMSERLNDTDFLARCQTSRILVESWRLVHSLFRRSKHELEEVSNVLSTPVNLHLIRDLLHLNDPSARIIANFLDRFSRATQEGQDPAIILEQEREAVESALNFVPRLYRWQDTFASRVP